MHVRIMLLDAYAGWILILHETDTGIILLDVHAGYDFNSTWNGHQNNTFERPCWVEF